MNKTNLYITSNEDCIHSSICNEDMNDTIVNGGGGGGGSDVYELAKHQKTQNKLAAFCLLCSIFWLPRPF